MELTTGSEKLRANGIQEFFQNTVGNFKKPEINPFVG